MRNAKVKELTRRAQAVSKRSNEIHRQEVLNTQYLFLIPLSCSEQGGGCVPLSLSAPLPIALIAPALKFLNVVHFSVLCTTAKVAASRLNITATATIMVPQFAAASKAYSGTPRGSTSSSSKDQQLPRVPQLQDRRGQASSLPLISLQPVPGR
jgi:hypothetical protein